MWNHVECRDAAPTYNIVASRARPYLDIDSLEELCCVAARQTIVMVAHTADNPDTTNRLALKAARGQQQT